jgi:hypothetical protein
MSLLAGMLAWSSVAVHAAAVVKLCERKYQLPGAVVTVPETVQYVLGTAMTCLEADLLSPLPSARILDPAPEALSSLLKTVRSLPVVLPKQPSGSPAATISNACPVPRVTRRSACNRMGRQLSGRKDGCPGESLRRVCLATSFGMAAIGDFGSHCS